MSSFFTLLGSARVKVGRKHVDEIDPWVAKRTVNLYCEASFAFSEVFVKPLLRVCTSVVILNFITPSFIVQPK